MIEVLERKMAQKCSTCAFRPGTAASQSEVTLKKASLCIDTGEPFLCHESPIDAWCAGVVGVLEKRYAAGTLMSDPQWKRDLKLAMNAAISRCEDGEVQTDAEISRIFREEFLKAMEASARRERDGAGKETVKA